MEANQFNRYEIQKRFHKINYGTFFYLLLNLAGAVGIEPTSKVLETFILPMKYAPICGVSNTYNNR